MEINFEAPRTTKAKILKHLQKKGSITSWEAISLFSYTRLSGVIHVLRDEGYNITSRWAENNGKRFTIYELIEDPA